MDWADQAASKVLADLQGRKGVGDVLHEIESDDPETWREMHDTLSEVIYGEFERVAKTAT